jgi:hypothetical protein
MPAYARTHREFSNRGNAQTEYGLEKSYSSRGVKLITCRPKRWASNECDAGPSRHSANALIVATVMSDTFKAGAAAHWYREVSEQCKQGDDGGKLDKQDRTVTSLPAAKRPVPRAAHRH